MRFIRRHWYNVGGAVAVMATVVLIAVWRDTGVLQRLLVLNFIALLIHQYEEYAWPGGLPAILNMAVWPNPNPDRYPLNQNSAMAVNVLAAYGFYLVPVFFPAAIWLGLAPVLVGIAQITMHGLMLNERLKSVYNPGLASVVLGHIPIGLYYIYYVHAGGLVSIWDWVFGVAYLAAFQFGLMLNMTFAWLVDRNSPYAFTDEEMRRFDVPRKLARLGAGQPPPPDDPPRQWSEPAGTRLVNGEPAPAGPATERPYAIRPRAPGRAALRFAVLMLLCFGLATVFSLVSFAMIGMGLFAWRGQRRDSRGFDVRLRR